MDDWTIECKKSTDGSLLDVAIEDKGNGKYICTYTNDEACEVEIKCIYNELDTKTLLRGCPFKAKFVEEAANKKDNELNGPGMINYIKNKNVELEAFITNKAAGIKLDDKD